MWISPANNCAVAHYICGIGADVVQDMAGVADNKSGALPFSRRTLLQQLVYHVTNQCDVDQIDAGLSENSPVTAFRELFSERPNGTNAPPAQSQPQR